MKILLITTKAPWPPIDGGRLVVWNTLKGLAAQGHQLGLVAPIWDPSAKADDIRKALAEVCTPYLVPARPRPLPIAFVASSLSGRSLSVTRHALAPVRREVERLLAAETWDVVQAEPVQAFAQAEPALSPRGDQGGETQRRGGPVVLRPYNVESDLWAATAEASGLTRPLLRREARRMARDEGAAVARAAVTATLTREDAERLRELAAPQGHVEVVRVPFASELPAAEAPLAGSPALVLMGSEGWLPNRDAVDYFVDTVWPAVHHALPEARLHVFGNLRRDGMVGVLRHAPPSSSREVFAPGSVMVVPLRIGSGVRVKILEAWARGIPVVSTPRGALGLEAEDGRDVLIAADRDGFVDAFQRLHAAPELRSSLVAAGRASLVERHDPAKVCADLVTLYQSRICSAP